MRSIQLDLFVLVNRFDLARKYFVCLVFKEFRLPLVVPFIDKFIQLLAVLLETF